MLILFFILSALFILLSVLPLSRNQHWIVRICDFLKLHVFIGLLLTIILGFWLINDSVAVIILMVVLFAFAIYHAIDLFPYTTFYKTPKSTFEIKSKSITLISYNVYQLNKEYSAFVNLIEKHQPDLVLTMESDRKWELEMKPLEKLYKTAYKIPQDNTYGMHLYTNLKVKNIKTNYFVSDDIPSIEADLETEDDYRFQFFGLHPPPPSPTEESTSKERDGELMSAAKRIRKLDNTTVVAGDFNQVTWGYSNKLFQKISQLVDPRRGRGFVSTFHAKYKLLRIPIDQLFHSANIYVETLKTLEPIGSDHLPLFCQFRITKNSHKAKADEIEDVDAEEEKEAEEIIEKGKKEKGDRD